MKMTELTLKEIHPDFFFCFTARAVNPHLMLSIQTSGIRTPVHAVSHDNGFRLVSGFKRLAAACALGFDVIPAEIVEYSAISHVFLDVIREHCIHSPLTLPEKARIVGIFEQLNADPELIRHQLLQLIDLPRRQNLAAELEKIRSCSEPLQRYLEQYDVSLRKSVHLISLTPEEQALVMNLADRLQLRPVELTEIVTWMTEIAKRESLQLAEILDMPALSLIADDDLNRNEKIKVLKTVLHAKRFPQLNRWRDDLTRLSRELQLPSFMVLAWDDQLEHPGIRLQASLGSDEDVKAAGESLLKAESRKLWKELFNLI